jgi:hypothetical protein
MRKNATVTLRNNGACVLPCANPRDKHEWFGTQLEAKRFFLDKVLAQARAEGVSLSDAER